MVHQMEESSRMSSANLGNTQNLGEDAVILISIGSVLVILCAATIIYGLRRRRLVSATTGGPESIVHNPTDYMNSLATWDPINEILEKRRQSVWTLEIFENYGSGENKQPATT